MPHIKDYTIHLTYSKKGFEAESLISEDMFQPNNSTLASVVCNEPYYGTDIELENEVCDFISQTINNNVEVLSNRTIITSDEGTDSKSGHYFNSLEFQIFKE